MRRSYYFDTSAMMRFLLRGRAGHEAAAEAWLSADQVSSVRITYAEMWAALASTHRQRAITTTRHRRIRSIWDSMWPDLAIIEVDHDLVVRAARLAERHALRGYDAVQLAAAEGSGCDVLVSADHALNKAATRLRIEVLDLNSSN